MRSVIGVEWLLVYAVVTGASIVVCFTLTSQTCRSLGYNVTGLPNVFGQMHVSHADDLLATLMSLESTQCSHHVQEFACAAAFPQCTSSGRLLHPCRDFCLGELP